LASEKPMGWKDIVEWIKKLLPAQLRVPFTTGVMVLAVVCLCTVFIVEWREVFRVWWTPLVAGGISAYWASVFFKVRKSFLWRWPDSLSLTMAVALVLVAVALTLFSYDRSRYRYDSGSGFFLSRNWQPDREHGKGFFEWSLEPTTDAGRDKTFILGLQVMGNCDLGRFEGPAPERESNTIHGPVIADNSSLEDLNRTWSVKDLHRGEEIKFRLFVKDENGSADSICFIPYVHAQ
jgi:hypothetical protein